MVTKVTKLHGLKVIDVWKKTDLETRCDSSFQFGTVPVDIESPLQYFKQFVTDEMLQNLSEQTNLYYFQQQGKPLGTTPKEIEIFIGIIIKIGIRKLPSLRHYWSKALGDEGISTHMSRNRFEILLRHIHS